MWAFTAEPPIKPKGEVSRGSWEQAVLGEEQLRFHANFYSYSDHQLLLSESHTYYTWAEVGAQVHARVTWGLYTEMGGKFYTFIFTNLWFPL